MTRMLRHLAAAAFVSVALLLGSLTGCGKEPLSPTDSAKQTFYGIPNGTLPADQPPLTAVPGEIICRVYEGWTIEQVNAMFGTHTLHVIPQTWTYLLAAPAGREPDQLVAEMEASGLCEDVDLNYHMQTPESEQASLAIYEGGFDHRDYIDQYALDRIGAAQAHAISTGAGILVAVIDTGADLDHPDLVDNLVPGYDFIDEDNEPADLPNGIDDNQNNLIDEGTGHGSHVAGIVAAAAPQVQLLPLRVLDSDGIGTAYNVTRAIYYAVQDGAKVINLSLGLDARVNTMRRAIQEARQAGVLVVSSAGNQGVRDEHHFPASLSEVMAVAATNAADRKAAFSNYGSHISISAPGEGIMSTYWNGGYAVWSGTSMATPFISGAAALRLAIETCDAGSLQEIIEDTSFDLDQFQSPYRGLLGEGRVDLLSLVMSDERNGGPDGDDTPQSVNPKLAIK